MKPVPPRPTITIGNIMLTDDDDPQSDKIWLSHRDGEAGQFSRAKLAQVLEKFFHAEF